MYETELQQRVQAFIRRFGLLRGDTTPCGRPLSPSQSHALQVISQAGPISQQVLSDELNLDKSTTSRLVSQLVEAGWVQRAVNPASRREFLLSLSPAGQRVLGEVKSASAGRFRGVLERIPPEKREQVLESLDLLTDALRKDDTP